MRNLKFLVLVISALILVAILGSMVACSSSPSTTAPAKTTAAPAPASSSAAPAPASSSAAPKPSTSAPATSAAPASSPAASVKPIVLKFSTHNPPSLSVSISEKAWADKINELSGGRLQFQMYYSESLAKQSEIFKALQTGTADIGYMVVGSDASQTPLSMISRRAFMGIPSIKANSSIFWDLYNKYPEMQAEWKNMKMLTANGLPPDQFFFVKKAVRVPTDMEGMKVIARGDYPAIMEAIKAVPVGLNVADWYSGVDKGLVEGQVGIHFLAVNSFKLLDLYKYYTIFGDGGADMATEVHAINVDAYNKLPPDLQKIFLDSCKWYQDLEDKATIDGQNEALAVAKNKGTFVNLTAADLAAWQKVTDPLDKKYIADNASKGNAQGIYDDVKAFAKKYANVK
jgi:TRAP-type transport system periplasmic protein